MARMIPPAPYPDCQSDGELDLFARLRDEPGTENWTVLHSLCIAEHRRQQMGEADFIAIAPGLGVLIIEVKGCHSVRFDRGDWYYGLEPTPDRRGPFRQASAAMWSVRDWLLNHRPDLSTVPFWSAVVFPFCPVPVTSPEWHSWQIVDSRTYRQKPIGQHIVHVLRKARELLLSKRTAWLDARNQEPTAKQSESIAALLRPRYEFYESPRSRARRLDEELKRFTDAQCSVLDQLEDEARLLVRGPAGTGKTLLAIEAARRAAASPVDGSATSSRRVLLVCFNNLLGAWLKEQTEPLRPAVTAGTLHRYMMDVCGIARAPDSADRAFWRELLPAQTRDVLRANSGGPHVFDYLVIDEVQDLLHGPYLDVLDLSLRGGLAAGQWRAFGDLERQAIFESTPSVVDAGVQRLRSYGPSASLRENCRNPPRIAELAHLLGGLTPRYRRVLRPDDGREHELLFYADDTEQCRRLVDALSNLVADGIGEGDIVVLSPRSEERCVAALITDPPWRSRLQPLSRLRSNGIRYGTIHAFKGLEARAVVLTDVESLSNASSLALFYVGVTRTQGRLIILAQEAVRAEMLKILMGTPHGGPST